MPLLTRILASLILGAYSMHIDASDTPGPARPFITVKDGQFFDGDAPYCFLGANTWYGAYLGADTVFGDRQRLRSELDQLLEAGVRNVRVLGASEASPLRDSLKNTFRDKSDRYNEALLEGLDFLLTELANRDMKAVIYLNNFWEWSGGMATYLYWTNSGHIVDPSSPDHPWPAFADFSAGFYQNGEAKRLFREYVSHVVSRVNSITGVPYADDPAIMSWQLANEPRPGYHNALGFARLDDYYSWIEQTARLIKDLDPNHLVSTGSEGTMGCLEDEACYLAAHSSELIDYLTFHMWPNNWGWYDPHDMQGTFEKTVQRSHQYIDRHLALAAELGKPIVMEEFGLNRDSGSFAPDSSTMFRDRFYALIFARLERDLANGGYFKGSNFWAWGGAGRAQHKDFLWGEDDRSYTGDPPQEAQGLYSVFNSDRSTIELLQRHARHLAEMNCAASVTRSTE